VEETLTIRWNGEVVPCCYDLTSRCVLGSIGRRDLEGIWNGDVFLALRESFRSGKHHPLCGSCALVSDAVTLTLRDRDSEPSP
jgi:radical SAM protein with 4Fe4S-binding SPASM domain